MARGGLGLEPTSVKFAKDVLTYKALEFRDCIRARALVASSNGSMFLVRATCLNRDGRHPTPSPESAIEARISDIRRSSKLCDLSNSQIAEKSRPILQLIQ